MISTEMASKSGGIRATLKDVARVAGVHSGTASRALDRGRGVTAIVAGNDLMALGCYEVFIDRGIRYPAEISVVGFNDMPFADRFHPPLTTVRVPHYEIGARAAELLLELLEYPETTPEHGLLKPQLVVRDSTAPPRAERRSDAGTEQRRVVRC